MPSFILIHPTVWATIHQPHRRTDRMDRQTGKWCDSIGRTVLQTVAQQVLFFMVALCNRADHIYFHPVVCSFFPRLVSAVRDWMFAILPHMVWP